MAFKGDLNLEATELRLGLPGTADHEKKTPPAGLTKSNKRGLLESAYCDGESNVSNDDPRECDHQESTRPAK